MPRVRPWLKALQIAWMFVWGFLAVALILPLARLCLGKRSVALEEAVVTCWHRRVCGILGLRLRIEGQPSPEARLIVANHISWLDIVVLGAQFPCLFVAKGDVAQWPVIGYLAQGIGTLFVKRGDAVKNASTAELMVWRLRQGRRLLLFPEGTTSRGDSVLRFHRKLFKPARQAGASVQAVAIRYRGEAKLQAPFVDDDEFLPHLFRLLRLETLDVEVHFCRPLAVCGDHRLTAATAHDQILAVVDPFAGRSEQVQTGGQYS